MTELEALIDFHRNSKRQGPGSTSTTLKALEFMHLEQNKDLKVADIGCGSGAQTMVLAQNIKGKITAVDLSSIFLEQLNNESKELGLQGKITTLEKSMDDLPFDRNEFDIIWSEGAIYNIGFESGIKKWKEYLKPGGYLAVSEITWLTDVRPLEIETYWKNEYPEIDTASAKIRLLEENGYTLVGYFVLPPECWLDNYYQPIEDRFDDFLEKHHHSELVKNLIAAEKEEISNYKKYKAYFSYGFYIAKKLG